jgi:hypothetical protein
LWLRLLLHLRLLNPLLPNKLLLLRLLWLLLRPAHLLHLKLKRLSLLRLLHLLQHLHQKLPLMFLQHCLYPFSNMLTYIINLFNRLFRKKKVLIDTPVSLQVTVK